MLSPTSLAYNGTKLLWTALDWVYPPACAGCGKQNYRLCPDCLAQIKVINQNQCVSCGAPVRGNHSRCSRCRDSSLYLNSISSWAEYEDPLRRAIHSLKYKQNIGLADTFASFLILLLKQKNLEFDLVVPIPLGSTREKQRGFNQAELLARPLSLYFGIPLSCNAVRRIKETDSQVKLSAKERSLNMEGAFFGNTAKLKGKRVLLVDDIITTGATMNHCAKAILESGASCVHGISVAKTMQYNNPLQSIP